VTFYIWLIAGLFVAGHLVWGPRWMLDGTRGIWAVYADLFSRRTRRDAEDVR
jgi:hypothetical protein